MHSRNSADFAVITSGEVRAETLVIIDQNDPDRVAAEMSAGVDPGPVRYQSLDLKHSTPYPDGRLKWTNDPGALNETVSLEGSGQRSQLRLIVNDGADNGSFILQGTDGTVSGGPFGTSIDFQGSTLQINAAQGLTFKGEPVHRRRETILDTTSGITTAVPSTTFLTIPLPDVQADDIIDIRSCHSAGSQANNSQLVMQLVMDRPVDPSLTLAQSTSLFSIANQIANPSMCSRFVATRDGAHAVRLLAWHIGPGLGWNLYPNYQFITVDQWSSI